MCFWGLFLQAPASIVRKNNCSIECCLLHTKHMMQKETGRYAARKYHSMNPETEVKTHFCKISYANQWNCCDTIDFVLNLKEVLSTQAMKIKSFSQFSKQLLNIDLSLKKLYFFSLKRSV